MTITNLRSDTEAMLRLNFENSLQGRIAEWIENTRDEREELLADELEEKFRAEFEDSLLVSREEFEAIHNAAE